MQRTQIYLDEGQTARLDAEARASGRTRSDLIRDAIGDYLDRNLVADAELLARQKRAFRAAFGYEPDLAVSVAELRVADARRTEELERRWTAAT